MTTVGRGKGSTRTIGRLIDDGPTAGATVIHLAGKAHDLKGPSDAHEYDVANFQLTRNLYEEFRASRAATFIFVSSVKALADVPKHAVREDDLADPRTPYGISKLKAERYLADHPADAGQSVYVLRPAMVHGPGVKGNLRLLHRLVSRGLPYPFGAFENRRSLLSVENFCYVVARAVDGTLPAGDYNLADDESLSTVDMVQALAEAAKKRARVWHVPRRTVTTMAALGDLLRLPLNTPTVQKLTGDFEVSTAKITQALGTSGLPVSARAGLRRTAAALALND